MAPGRTSLRLGLLLLLTLGVHARGLSGGFVYDDHRFVEHNTALSPIRPWAYLVDPATASAASGDGITADIYRPLRTLLFAVERALFGLWAPGWHALSLLLHAGVVALLYRLLVRFLGAVSLGPWLGAAIVAVHPATVESVAWVSSQGDLLAWLLLLAAFEVLARPGRVRTLCGALLTGLACLAKESALVAPVLLVLRDHALPGGEAPPARTTWSRAALLALVVAGYLALRVSVLPGLAQVPHPEGSPWASLRGFLLALSWYAGALLWPTGFRLETDLLVPLSWGDPSVVLGAGLLLTLLASGWVSVRRGRGAVLAWCAWGALVALGPVSQVLVPLKSLAAERFLYPLLPCLAAGLALGVQALERRWGRPAGLAPALLLVPLIWVTLARTAAWSDEESLWTAVRRDRPSNGRAYHGLGEALFAKGRFGEASAAYSTYLQAWRYDGKARRQFVDHLEGWIRTLRSDDPAIEASSNLGQRRRELRALQAGLLLSALEIWDEVGLEAGRGSRSWLVDTLDRLVEIALELGDLSLARNALNRRLGLEGVNPASPADPAAPLRLRTLRWLLAWRAVTTPEGALAPEQRRERQQQRADVLRDAGLDPATFDEALRLQLEPALLGFREEARQRAQAARGTPAAARADEQALALAQLHAELLALTGRREEAERLMRELTLGQRGGPAGGR